MSVELLLGGYACMAVIWLMFQLAANKAFPDNRIIPKSIATNRYGETLPSWGLLASVVWPAVMVYLIFLLILTPIKAGVKAYHHWAEEKKRLSTIPTLEYPGK